MSGEEVREEGTRGKDVEIVVARVRVKLSQGSVGRGQKPSKRLERAAAAMGGSR